MRTVQDNHTTKSQDIELALRTLKDAYRDRGDVTGYDVGFRWVGQTRSQQVCLRVHVAAKLPDDELSVDERIVTHVGGIPVDVVPATYKVHRTQTAGSNKQSSTLLSGSTCQRRGSIAGTIGAIAIEKTTGAPGILSNWHVLSAPSGSESDLVFGESLNAPPIARVTKSMLSAHGDAAFAVLTGATPWLPTLKQLNINLTGMKRSALGDHLCKYGRTTGLTQAVVDGEGYYKVTHTLPGGRQKVVETRGFRLVPDTNIAQSTALSLLGDSGASWVDPETGQVAGLHMAGEGDTFPNGDCALACHMETVLDHLDLRLATMDDLLDRGWQPEGNTPDPTPPSENEPSVSETCPKTSQNLGDFKPVHTVEGSIWPSFLDSMLTKHPHFRLVPFDIDDVVSDYFKGPETGQALRAIAMETAQFTQDNVIPDLEPFRNAITFRCVCERIADGYRARGYRVSA